MKHEKTTSEEKHGNLFLAVSFFVGLIVPMLPVTLVLSVLIPRSDNMWWAVLYVACFIGLCLAAGGVNYVAKFLNSLIRSKFYAEHIKDNPLFVVGILVIIALIFPPLERSGFKFGVIFFTRSSRIDYNVWFMEILVILIFSGLYLLHRKNSEKKDNKQEKDSDDFF